MRSRETSCRARPASVLASLLFALGVPASGRAQDAPLFEAEAIFAPEQVHNHASCIVECPDRSLLVSWYHGSGERRADDVVVLGARRRQGEKGWSAPFLLADTPGFPDTNPCLLVDPRGKLWLIWQAILANRWESALSKYKLSSDYTADGPPRWEEEKELLIKPGEEFSAEVGRVIEARRKAGAGRPAAALEEAWFRRIEELARDKLSTRLGWMTRAHPLVIDGTRMIVPLYSDGFSFSIMAITGDWGRTWEPSLPLVGGGNIQPTLVRRRDGSLVAYMRDNGPPPKRLHASESSDRGRTWTPVADTSIPNPGSGAEVLGLRSGLWALVNNDLERGRHRLSISLSPDEGRSWPWVRAIEPAEGVDGAREASYPSIIEDREGLIHVTYSRSTAAGRTIQHVRFNAAWVKAGGRRREL